jgi:peptidoglycan hydrolase CwlO-like protein
MYTQIILITLVVVFLSVVTYTSFSNMNDYNLKFSKIYDNLESIQLQLIKMEDRMSSNNKQCQDCQLTHAKMISKNESDIEVANETIVQKNEYLAGGLSDCFRMIRDLQTQLYDLRNDFARTIHDNSSYTSSELSGIRDTLGILEGDLYDSTGGLTQQVDELERKMELLQPYIERMQSKNEIAETKRKLAVLNGVLQDVNAKLK